MVLNIDTSWAARTARAVLLVRILVGWVFLSEGIQKFLFPDGFLTRLAAIPLLIDITVALYTTKIVSFAKNGLWSTLHEARTDVSMMLGLIFLFIVGGGSLALDNFLRSRHKPA